MRPKPNPKNKFICDTCRLSDRLKETHPGVRHLPGICDCKCRED